MLKYATEFLKEKGFAFDVVFLMQDHYSEVGQLKSAVPLSIFTDAYFTLEKIGMLRLYTVRTELDELVGYALFLLQPQIHHKDMKAALNMAVYLKPEYRGVAGFKFLKYCTEQLEAEAPLEIMWSVTVKKDFSRPLEKLGFQPKELIYSKFVGE